MSNKEHFDEKQIIDRGFAFKIGFIAMFAAFIAYRFFSEGITSPALNDSLFYIFLWIPIIITLIILIYKDAYDRVNSTGGRTVLSIFGVTGLLILIIYTAKMIAQGMDIIPHLGLMFAGFSMTLVSVVYFIKQYLNKKKYSEE